MRKPAFAGLLLCALFFGVQSPKVSAEASDILALDTNSKITNHFVLKDTDIATLGLPPPETPPPTMYVVKEGESLTSIAVAHNTTWRRLYDKNATIANPDIITPGIELIIPAPAQL